MTSLSIIRPELFTINWLTYLLIYSFTYRCESRILSDYNCKQEFVPLWRLKRLVNEILSSFKINLLPYQKTPLRKIIDFVGKTFLRTHNRSLLSFKRQREMSLKGIQFTVGLWRRRWNFRCDRIGTGYRLTTPLGFQEEEQSSIEFRHNIKYRV